MTEEKRLRGIHFWAVCVTLVATHVFAFGCKSSASHDPTGGETHWLQLCANDEGCSEGECLCGVCSHRCNETSECASGKRCEPSEVLSCTSGPSPGALCLPECTSDTCGPSARCSDGVCVPARNDELEAGAQSSDDPSRQTDASVSNSSSDDFAPDDASVSAPSVDGAASAQDPSQPSDSRDAAMESGSLMDADVARPSDAATPTAETGVPEAMEASCSGVDCSESCAVQDARFTAPCLGEVAGYAFDGTRCVSGCGCAGTECDQQFSSMQECVTEFASCLQSCESVPSETPACVACASETCTAGDPMIEVSDGCCVCQATVGVNAIGCVNPPTNGSVTIELEVLEEGYEMTGGCEVNSVSIFDEYGRAVWPMPRSSCVEDVESVVSIESTSIVWDGSSSREAFAAPGLYTAVVCANNPGSVFTCASVQFDYPSDEVVNVRFPASQSMTAAHFTCSETNWPCLVGRQWCDGTCRALPEECREDPCSCFEVGNIYRSWSDGDTLVEECRVDELGGAHVTATTGAAP